MHDKKEKRLWKQLEKTSYIALSEDAPTTLNKTMFAAKNTSKKDGRKQKVAALRRFQSFSALRPTGRVNKLTLAQAEEPYCSFPNVTTKELMAFSLAPPRWSTPNITYGLATITSQLSPTVVRQCIATAFGLWKSVFPAFQFREVLPSNSPLILIKFVTGSHLDGFPFDGAEGDLAHAFPPNYHVPGLAGDIHFDDAERWSNTTAAATKDLVTVAAHEIGHALGLGHSMVKDSLMFKTYQGSHRFLHQDDITNIRNLYS